MENKTKKASLTAGIVCGVVGLLIFGIPMGCVAIGIGSNVVKEGNGWGWVAIVLGAIDVIGGFIACVSMM